MSRRALTSFSELNCLSACEQRWRFRYIDKLDQDASRPRTFGSLFHAGRHAFWAREDVYAAVDAEWETLGLGDPDEDIGLHELYSDLVWLLERYVAFYAEQRDEVKVVATELELKAKLPGTNITVQGYIDQLWEINGKLWSDECKTMGKWDRLDIITVDPQLTLYEWLLRENGYEPYGIHFDAVKSYRWKPEKPTQKALIEENQDLYVPTGSGMSERLGALPKKLQTEWARAEVERHPGVERPLEDSFQQFWLARDQDQIDAALRWARAAVRRKRSLQAGSLPVRNLSVVSCRGCDYQRLCFEEMSFALDIDLEDD